LLYIPDFETMTHSNACNYAEHIEASPPPSYKKRLHPICDIGPTSLVVSSPHSTKSLVVEINPRFKKIFSRSVCAVQIPSHVLAN